MATDATGTPSTHFEFPKYDVDNDAPSGLGGNAIVDDIDSKLKTKVPNHLITSLATNDVPVWNGTTWVRPSGTASASTYLRGDGSWATISAASTIGEETTYTERTTPLSVTTTIADFIDSGSSTYAAVPYLIEFYAPALEGPPSAQGQMEVYLYDGSTDLGIIAVMGNVSWGSGNFTPRAPAYVARKYTPSAGSHQFKIRAKMSASTGQIIAGAGGSGGTYMPSFIRITRTT